MDVYHKILLKIYEVTGGKQSESVDLVDLVKQEGFFPSFEEIHRQLNRAGWIADTGRGNKVKITHWGVKEAKKSGSASPDADQKLKKLTNQFQDCARELLIMAEEFSGDTSSDKLKQVEKKFEQVRKYIDDIKSNI